MNVVENGVGKTVTVALAAEEWFWLRRLQALTGDEPETIIASMLRDIRIDDEQAHQENIDGGARH